MDIHRCRFVPFQSQPISGLAFSHLSNPSQATPVELRLAVGRETTGDIEIWNPLGGEWVQESVLRGSVGRSVEQLAWTQDLEVEDDGGVTLYKPGALRLFSIGGSKSITEWSLSSGGPKRHTEGNFGDIWCFAAQPRLDVKIEQEESTVSQSLVAGCGDGSIILFSTEDNDLRFSRLLLAKPNKKSKVLSITWRDRETVVAGYEDSTIRVIDVPNRKTIRTMTLGKPAEGTKSVVWTVKCLRDGTILSGDSSGELKIWDAKTLSLVQRLKTHQADILDLASNVRGDQIFSVGVDRRTVAYKLITTPGSKTKRWTELEHRRFHKHDVKCAVSYESEDMKVVVTGGMDAAPTVMPLQGGKKELHRMLPHLPQQPCMSSARRSRLFIAWWQRDILVYYIPKRNEQGQSLGSPDYDFLATLQLKGEEHIQCAQISEDGTFIIASTLAGARLFQLRLASSHGTLSLRTRPVDLPPSLRNFGSRLVGISPDTKWMYGIRPDNVVVLAKVLSRGAPKDTPTFHASITKLTLQHPLPPSPQLGTYASTICTATFSHNSRVVAVGTLSGHINTWVLSGHEDVSSLSPPSSSSGSSSESESDSDGDDESDTPTIHNQRWAATPPSTSTPYPSVSSPILCLTFRPTPSDLKRSSPSQSYTNIGLHVTRHTPHPIAHEFPSPSPILIAISAEHKLVEFDVYTGKLTEWSRRNQKLPKSFAKIRDRIKGCFWSPATAGSQRLWLYGNTWLYMLDLADDLTSSTDEELDNKRNGEERSQVQRQWHTFMYRDVLGVGNIGQNNVSDSADEVGMSENKVFGDVDMTDLDGADESDKRQMEVVIVERPIWDIEQPPRFDGGQDWES